jgi:hypothetical protein
VRPIRDESVDVLAVMTWPARHHGAPMVVDLGYAYHEVIPLRNNDGTPKRIQSRGFGAGPYLAPWASANAHRATFESESAIDIYQWG